MGDTGAILDYASPRKRSAFRLPAKSEITLSTSHDRVVVTESLAGRTQARVAVAFMCFALCVGSVATVLTAYDFRLHRFHRDWAVAVLFAPQVALGTPAMFCAVYQTWRRTVLTVTPSDWHLAFHSPFRTRRHRWPVIDIADFVVATNDGVHDFDYLDDDDRDDTPAELVVTRTDASDLRLFTGHGRGQLITIARALRSTLQNEGVNPAQA